MSVNTVNGNHNLAVYSLEMSMEIALKALLLGFDMDVPRTHNIGNLILKKLRESKINFP